MDPFHKKAARAAVLIHEQTLHQSCPTAGLRLPHYAWSTIPTLQRQIGVAIARGWDRAARATLQSLIEALDECRRDLGDALRTLQPQQPKQPVSAADIYQDLVALANEFEDVEIDLQEETIAVTTDRIVLDGVNLGRFRVRLPWQKLDASTAYQVEALDPNPAAKGDEYTHPHVRDEQLCEGEGRAAIRGALREGRLFDFFLFVSQVLHTYGQGSAYVELADWDGIPCHDCGASIDDEDRFHCSRCEISLCGSCAIPCSECGEQYCTNCIHSCSVCRQDYCSACLTNCSVCRGRVCANCSEDGLCLSCHQESEEDQDDELQEEAGTSSEDGVPYASVAGAAVESDSLGEAAVFERQG